MLWIGLGIISALLWGVRDVLAKRTLMDAKPGHVAFTAGFLLMCLSLLYFQQIQFILTWEQFGFIALRAALLSCATLCLYTAMKQLHLRVYEPMLNLSPVLLVVFAAILLGEHLHYMQLLGILLLILSAFALHFHGSFHMSEIWKSLGTKPMLILYLGLLCMTFSAISTKHIGTTMNFSTLMFHYAWMFVVIQGSLLIARGEFRSMLYTFERHRTLMLVGGALFFVEMSFYLMAVVHPLSLITLLIPIRRLSTFFGTILGGVYYHEGNLWHSAVVSVVMLVGVFFVSFFGG